MTTTTLPGGTNDILSGVGNKSANVYGQNIAVTALNIGCDTISLSGWGSVTAANTGNDTISLTGTGVVTTQNVGNDSITFQGSGTVTAKNYGNDTINVGGTVSVNAGGANYSINVGPGNDTIAAAGHATVLGVSGSTFGSATLVGGTLQITSSGGKTDVTATGTATLVGSASPTYFTATGNDSVTMTGHSGKDTFVGGSGSDTMTAVAHTTGNVFEFLGGGSHFIYNFAAGDELYVEGYSLSALTTNHEITSSGGNTIITIGSTKITLEGVAASSLTASEFLSKKI